jgi:hypothetical protein
MNNVMRTLGGALGGQLSATFIADHMVKGLPAVTGFTETFLMATGFLLLCFGAGLLVPRTLGSSAGGSGPNSAARPVPEAARA